MRRSRQILTFLFVIFSGFLCYVVQAQLTISEVYFAGTDEWIELSNTSHTDFSGDVSISGAKSTPILINHLILSGGNSLLFGDRMEMLLNHDKVAGTGLGMSIYDTRDLAIDLSYSGNIIDSIRATSDELAELKIQKASLQKIISGSTFITTGAQYFTAYNVATGYLANPGIIYTRDFSSSSGDNNTNTTGDTTTGDTTTGNITTGTITFCSGGAIKLRITEIFPGDSTYSAFIELQAIEDVDEDVVFSGTLLTTTISEHLRLDRGEYTLISAEDSGWLSIIDTHINTSFELNNSGGSMVLYGQSGQVLDSVSSLLRTGGYSYYTNSADTGVVLSGMCLRDFNTQKFFSPGFDEKFLYYMSSGIQYIETGSTETVVYITSGCDISSGDTNTGDNTATGSSNPSIGDLTHGNFIEIVSIDYDPPGSDTNNEKIVLKSHVAFNVNIDHLRLHSVSRTTKNRIYGEISAYGQKQLIGNYRFPNSANCVELLSGDIVLDTYCYNPTDTTTNEENNNDTSHQDTSSDDTSNTGNSHNTANLDLIIENIIYDVPGSDKNKESIIIKSLSHQTIQEADIKTLSLMIGTRKNKLYYPTLNVFSLWGPGETKNLTGNFRFPNSKDTCVALMQNERILDRYCYHIADGPENIAKNIQSPKNLTSNMSGKIKIVAILPNPVGNDVGAETIALRYIPNSGEKQKLDVDSNFHLQIGSKHKSITATLLANKTKTIAGNFSFPNKSACVSVVYHTDILDTFCYENPKEGELFTHKNGVLERLSTIDLFILQKSSLKKINKAGEDKICLTYNKQTIYCKQYAFSSKDPDELKLYKNYVNVLNAYLSTNRPTLFYNSPLQYYRQLLQQDKTKIHNKQKTISRYGKEFKSYDIEAQAKEIIFATPTEILQRKIIEQTIPDNLRKHYYFLLHTTALSL